MSFLVTCSNVPHRSIKTKSARFSTGRDKQCKGRTKHGRKERIHSCHHWVDFSMTLGHTGQRTIGWRRHGWALKLKWKRATDHARLWIQNATKAQRIVEFSAAHRARNTLAARIWFPFFLKNRHNFSLFFIFLDFSVEKEQKKEKKRKQKKNREKKRKNRFLTSGHIFSIENQMQVIPLARNPREKKEKTRKKRKNTEKKEKQKKKKQNNKKKKRKKQMKKITIKNKTKKEKKKTCHRFCNLYQSPLCNSCLENCSQKSCCSDL